MKYLMVECKNHVKIYLSVFVSLNAIIILCDYAKSQSIPINV